MDTKLNTYIEGIDNNEYHADKDYLSSSQLKYAVQDHGNFLYEMHNRKQPEKTIDSAMDLGSLTHAMLLEPETVDTDFAFMDTDGRNWRTKVDREYKAQFLEAAGNKMVLSYTAKKKAELMCKNVMEHPFFNRLLTEPGKAEMSGFFEDTFYDVKLRFRPDRKVFDIDGAPAILDVKSTANMDDFFRVAKYQFHYDLSAVLYLEGNHKVTGEPRDIPYYLGVVESQAPYRVAVYKASERFLEQGRKKYVNALSNIKIAYKQPQDNIVYQSVDYQEI
jgi:hypothetical protein